MKKKIGIILTFGIMITSLLGCGSKKPEPKKYNVEMISSTLKINKNEATEGQNLDATIETINGDYTLPQTLEKVTISGDPISSYTYVPSTGSFHIDASLIKGKIEIKGEGVPVERYIRILNKDDMFDIDDKEYALNVETKNIDENNLDYVSSDESVATIDKNGISFTDKQGTATVSIISKDFPNIKDSFTFTTTKKIVKGTIVDKDSGAALNGVLISSGGNSKLFDNGEYKLALPEEEAVVYFEKEGYITESRVIYQTNTTIKLDVTMQSAGEYKIVTISGNVTDFATGKLLPNIGISVKTDIVHTTRTDANGHYVFKNIPAGNHVVIETFYHSYTSVNKDVVIQDTTVNQDLVLQGHQNWMRFYVENPVSDKACKTIYGKVFHVTRSINGVDKKGIEFTMKSNFDNAFAESTTSKIFLDLGPKSNHDREITKHLDGRDVDVKFSPSGTILDVNWHGGNVGTGDLVITTDYDRNLSVFIPNTYIKVADNSKETIGFAYGYNGDELTEEATNKIHCWPFGAPVRQRNKHSFARLEFDNTAVSASDNEPEDILKNIDYDTIDSDNNFYSSGVLGSVGLPHSGGFDAKIVKRRTTIGNDGVYFLSKSTYPDGYTEFYMRDNTERHFYIDTKASEYNRPTLDDTIIPIFNNGNSFLATAEVDDVSAYVPYDVLYTSGIRYYSRGPVLMFFIPYSKLGITHTQNIGISFKLDQHGSRSWGEQGWKFPRTNPTGYSTVPTCTIRQSYIHLNQELKIVPYPDL